MSLICKILLALLAATSTAFANDFGVDTAFHNWAGSDPEYGPSWLPPEIQLGMPEITWVRSDIGEIGYQGTTLGTWSVANNPHDDEWIKACHAAGLKVMVILNQYYLETGYQNGVFWAPGANGVIPAAAFSAWLATNEPIDCIEVGNEIQNSWSQWGSTTATAEMNYVAALNAITSAVHAANPNVKVIGMDAQGSAILAMLNMGPVCDGVVFHPYANSSGSPESAYEPPYDTDKNGFADFVKAIQAATTIPIWVTEQGPDSESEGAWGSEYNAAYWWSRRLVLSLWARVGHNFAYQYIGSDFGQSILDYYDHPRQAHFAIDRAWNLLSPMTPDNNTPTASSTDPNYSAPNFIGLDFTQGTTSVAVVWEGYSAVGKGDVGWTVGGGSNPVAKATINAIHTGGPVAVLAQDLATGEIWYPEFTQTGNMVAISGEVGQDAIAYTISPGSAAIPPIVLQAPSTGQSMPVGSATWSFGGLAPNGKDYYLLLNGSSAAAAGGYAVVMFNESGSVDVLTAFGQWFQWTGDSWVHLNNPPL